MKKITQYIITAFLALMTLGGFALSLPSGIIMLLATLLACPLTRNIGINFLKNKCDKFPVDKIKGWMYALIVTMLFMTSVMIAPTSENSNENLVAENVATEQAETVSDEKTEENDESIPSNIEDSVESNSIMTESSDSNDIQLSDSTTTIVEPTEVILEESIPGEVVVEENIKSDMEVHFIDVGQGDATLIKADGQYMLIDAGDNNMGTTVQLYLQKQGVNKLDYLILTHTDADHIGGADVIITKFDINTVFIGDFKKDNKTYKELMNALNYKGLKYSIPTVGSEYKLGNASFTIVAPNNTYSDPNNSSIALVLKNGDNSFLFTGDCEEPAELDIMANGLNIDCDVYKLGHHGSKTASSQSFLAAITPTYGVISCAEDNSYGHPHAEPLNNLRTMGVKVFRTDEQGSIIAYSNGTEITWNCAPSETWKAGEIENTSEITDLPTTTSSPIAETMAPENNTVVVAEPIPEVQETTSNTITESKSSYAVNGKNGKIHIVGGCAATGNGDNAMDIPVYFNTYEEAEAYSIQIAPSQKKRQCGNCW